MLGMAPSVFRRRKISLISFCTVRSAIAGQSGTCGGRGEKWQAASDKPRASSSLHLALVFYSIHFLLRMLQKYRHFNINIVSCLFLSHCELPGYSAHVTEV